MKLINLKIAPLILLFCTQLVFSQNYADKKYYLVDSLVLESLSESDLHLIDSILPLYHQSKNDTLKLSYINKITEDCLDDNVWPKYNQLLNDEAREKLSNPKINKEERVFLKKALAASINNMGYIDYNLGNYDVALGYYQQSLDLYLEIHDKDGIATCYNNIGSIYDDEGNTNKALEYYLKSLNFREQINDLQGIALSLNNIGYIYSDKGQIEKALSYYGRSIKILEQLDDKQVLATTFNNVGYVYKIQKDFDKALEYYFKCLKIFEEIDYKEGIAGSYNNIGLIYSKNQNTVDKALDYYQKSLELQTELEHKKGVAETANNIGVIYNDKGQYDKALEYFNTSLKIREEVGDKAGVVNSLSSIGNAKLSQGKIKEAKAFALKSYELSRELGFPDNLKNSAYLLSLIYNEENDPVNELKMYKLYVEMRDSIVNEDTKKASIKHDLQYQFEKQALTDSLARAEAEKIKDLKYDQEIKQQKTYSLIGIVGFVLMVIVVIVVLRGYQLKRKSNLQLEEKNKVIEEKNHEITDSINYAKRIQKAIIPPSEDMNRHLKNGFVIYKPKDIVAGDFYWMQVVKNDESPKSSELILFATADCTGHGVPGAMVSVVCHNALNRAVREYNLSEPAKILDKTREIVIETFKSSRDSSHLIKDGMDIALCAIDFSTNILQYSGANNSLYIIRNRELMETKADKQPVGRHHNEQVPFTNHIIQLQKEDCIYTFSDGYADQFGGEKGKKFMYKQFKELLVSISNKSMNEQKNILLEKFDKWKGGLQQVDDVCIIGVRI